MQRLLLTLDTPAANLALDEALLDMAEMEGADAEYLRLWESPQPVVVLGRSSRIEVEVDRQACAARGVPILRRPSGGATIVAGPGCLMYGVVLGYERRPESRGVNEGHGYVLARLAEALAVHEPTVTAAGTSDLAFIETGPAKGNMSLRKFSGNSMRVKRTHFLYHGTLLYDFDLSLASACLRTPPRQPAYREARDHAEFIANLPLANSTLEDSVLAAWPTTGELVDWPRDRVEQLVAERYGRDDWNLAYGDAPMS